MTSQQTKSGLLSKSTNNW